MIAAWILLSNRDKSLQKKICNRVHSDLYPADSKKEEHTTFFGLFSKIQRSSKDWYLLRGCDFQQRTTFLLPEDFWIIGRNGWKGSHSNRVDGLIFSGLQRKEHMLFLHLILKIYRSSEYWYLLRGCDFRQRTTCHLAERFWVIGENGWKENRDNRVGFFIFGGLQKKEHAA